MALIRPTPFRPLKPSRNLQYSISREVSVLTASNAVSPGCSLTVAAVDIGYEFHIIHITNIVPHSSSSGPGPAFAGAAGLADSSQEVSESAEVCSHYSANVVLCFDSTIA